jgi:hypothetical protein
MLRLGLLAGVLLTATGLLLVLLFATGFGLMPDGTDAAVLGVDVRSFLTVAAGLCLACGITLVGLGFGHWQHPVPPGPSLDHTPDARHR